MNKRRLVITFLVVLTIVSIVLLTIKRADREKYEDVVMVVRTAKLSAELPMKSYQISGTTQSTETTMLRFQVGGRVTKKSIRLGDSVAKGESLALLYNPELGPLTAAAKDNLSRLTAQAKQAQLNFARVDALYQEQAVTLAEWESVRTALSASNNAQSAAKSEFDRATQVTDELNLRAPFAGSATEIIIDVGDVVAAGDPAVRLSNPNMVELKLAVSDTIAEQLQLGKIVHVSRSLQPNELTFKGVVSEISPHRERGSLPEVIISLDAAEIGPGVAVNANIKILAKQGLSIPIHAVLMTGESTVAVYRVVDGIAKLVPIRPLRLDTETVLIDQGLAPGDALVVEGISQLYDGANVIVVDAAVNSENTMPESQP